MRIGILLPNWVGDVAMATPALRLTSVSVCPQARLVGVGGRICCRYCRGPLAKRNTAPAWEHKGPGGRADWRRGAGSSAPTARRAHPAAGDAVRRPVGQFSGARLSSATLAAACNGC